VFARTFAISWIAYFGFYLCRKNFSVLMPYLKSEAGLTADDFANAIFGYSLLYAAGQFLMGRLTDRIGARWVAGFGLVATACLSACLAWAPLTAAVALSVAGIQSVNGLAQACGWPSVLRLAREWFPTENRGISMGGWSTHMVLGGFAGTWLAARCAETHWTRAALVPGAVVLAIAAVYLLFARDKTREPSSRTPAAKPEPGSLENTPSLAAIAAMYSCVKMTRYAFLFWLPLYMTEHLHYAKGLAGYASSAFELIGIGGALTAGYLSERLRGDRFGVSAVMLVILALLCATYAQASAMGLEVNLLWIGLVGFFTFGPDTLMAGPALQDLVPARSIGSAAGFVNGTGSLGQVIAPFAVA
jgi:OPA family sugar phosphate sensor protein UhpC-like MFS transporter